MKNNLLKYWLELGRKYTNNNTLLCDIYFDIEERYSASNRHYHNLTHIEKMLNEIYARQDKIKNLDKLLFSAWFHDIIYNPWRKNNEEKSAAYAIKQLSKIGVDNNLIQEIKYLILQTQNHLKDNRVNEFDDQLFLDIDILILAADRNEYAEYLINVKKEYWFVVWGIFKERRKAFCNALIAKNNIYFTKEFQELYEEKAKNNLREEVRFNASYSIYHKPITIPSTFKLQRYKDDSYLIKGFDRHYIRMLIYFSLPIIFIAVVTKYYSSTLLFVFISFGLSVKIKLEKNTITIIRSFYFIKYFSKCFQFTNVSINNDSCTFMNNDKVCLEFWWESWDYDGFFAMGDSMDTDLGFISDYYCVVEHLKKVYTPGGNINITLIQ